MVLASHGMQCWSPGSLSGGTALADGKGAESNGSGTNSAIQQDTREAERPEADKAVKEEEEGTVDQPGPSSRLEEVEGDEIRTVTAGDTLYSSAARFEDLPISEPLLQGLYTEMKFEKPSKIQAVTLPMVLRPPFVSLVAQAHNGSGKTTCFVLAMLSRVDPTLQQPQALCVCPTRELVLQNLSVLHRMGKFTTITSLSTAATDLELPRIAQMTAIGCRGARITQQVVLGTHGKLKTWMGKRMLGLTCIKVLVMDEADEMLKQDGFAADSVRMIRSVRTESPRVQVLLFSATFNDAIRDFAIKFAGKDANQVFVPKEQLSLDVIKQYKVVCPTGNDKFNVLKEMVFPLVQKLGQTIIFVRTRETARALHSQLEKGGYKCTSIQGDMDMTVRDRVVNEFRDGKTRVLIATDVLSRGFDVQQVNLVINFNVPTERDQVTPAFETYLHRIGRSGRFGRRGAAFNLVTGPAEVACLDRISDYFQHAIDDVPYDDEDKFEQVLIEAGLTRGMG